MSKSKKPSFPVRFFSHLKTILVHKYWVFICCCKVGMPIRGFFHDMSKLSPVEFWEGVKYYRDEHTSPINYAKADKGYSNAWFHHRSHNKHHYEHWMDNFDQGGENILMPFKYALEMICDYIAAGYAYNGKHHVYECEYEWWQNRKKKPLAMHPALQAYVTDCLQHMAKTGQFISRNQARTYYEMEKVTYLIK